jgi:hypothetical protein
MDKILNKEYEKIRPTVEALARRTDLTDVITGREMKAGFQKPFFLIHGS